METEQQEKMQDEEKLVLSEDDQALSQFVSDTLEKHNEVLQIEAKIMAFATNITEDYDTLEVSQLLRYLSEVQERIIDETLKKAGNILSSITCVPGVLEAETLLPGAFIAGTPARYTPGFCKPPQYIPSKICNFYHSWTMNTTIETDLG